VKALLDCLQMTPWEGIRSSCCWSHWRLAVKQVVRGYWDWENKASRCPDRSGTLRCQTIHFLLKKQATRGHFDHSSFANVPRYVVAFRLIALSSSAILAHFIENPGTLRTCTIVQERKIVKSSVGAYKSAAACNEIKSLKP
jgi:hypothetical protein